jgi:hypothetical protein
LYASFKQESHSLSQTSELGNKKAEKAPKESMAKLAMLALEREKQAQSWSLLLNSQGRAAVELANFFSGVVAMSRCRVQMAAHVHMTAYIRIWPRVDLTIGVWL